MGAGLEDTSTLQILAFRIVQGFTTFATDYLMPMMLLIFFVAIVARFLIYFTIKREDWFAREFEKRVRRFMDSEECTKTVSFFVTTKMLLERTFYELFEYRAIMKRRKPDQVWAVSDRIFLIQHGVAILVKDSIKQIKFLRYGHQPPKLLEISKNVFQNNPSFKKVFGILPIGPLNDVINILPGLFIIGGIFGTFLGIMRALPELGGMNLDDIEGTKQIMDSFLIKISFSMSTSIIGIVLSVLTTIWNTIFPPEKVFVDIIERFENCLDILWNRSQNNELPENIPDFDENRDPLDALAEEAVRNQLSKDKKEKFVYDGRENFNKDVVDEETDIDDDIIDEEIPDVSTIEEPDDLDGDIDKKAS